MLIVKSLATLWHLHGRPPSLYFLGSTTRQCAGGWGVLLLLKIGALPCWNPPCTLAN